MAKYKAIKRGYDGVKLREIGEEFEYSKAPENWMKPVEEPKESPKAEVKPEAKQKVSPKVEGK